MEGRYTMRLYETPELLQVGDMHAVVLGVKNQFIDDNPGQSPSNRLPSTSILDVD